MSTSTFSLVTSIGAALVAAWFLWGRAVARSDRTGVRTVEAEDLVRAAWIGVGWAAAQAAVGIWLLDFDLWDLMSIAFYDVVVALPLVGVGVLVAHGLHDGHPLLPAATRPAMTLACLALLPAAVGFYAARVEPYRLRTDRQSVAIDEARAGDDAVVIGVVADLQTVQVTDHERDAVQRVVDAEPDLILVAGDLFQGTPAQLDANRDALHDLLATMDAPGGAFVVPGDTDSIPVLEQLTRGTPVEVLTDETARVAVGDREVVVGGLTLEVTGAGLDVLAELEEAPGDEIRVLLAHRPDRAMRLQPDSRVDLVVAGHTHGGQIQVPGIGPLMTLSQVPRDVAGGGLHQLDGNAVYVSTGIGREQQGAPQVRFLAPPSVALLTLDG
jgi:predicted MPP superfamily phosphohydrolase